MSEPTTALSPDLGGAHQRAELGERVQLRDALAFAVGDHVVEGGKGEVELARAKSLELEDG